MANNQRVEPFETVRLHKDGRSISVSVTISPITDAAGRVVGASKIVRDISERKAKEQQVQFLLGELNHRSKNMLAVIQSIAHRTGNDTAPEFVKAFSERLQALAINHNLLATNEWHGVSVRALVSAQLQPFCDVGGRRVRVEGPEARLSAAAAQALGMAIHELATNACKYGALSAADGKIDVVWGINGAEFQASWIETGGPRGRVSVAAGLWIPGRLRDGGAIATRKGSTRLRGGRPAVANDVSCQSGAGGRATPRVTA